jgi:nitrogen regulatory protein PII
MEMIVITAVQAYQKEIKRILKENQVATFSYLDVTGHKEIAEESRDDNWFVSNAGEYSSVMFYAFVASGQVDRVLEAIASFNNKQEVKSHVHAVVMEIKKSV